MSTGKRTADHLPPSEQVSNRPRYIPSKFLGVLLQRNPVSSPPYVAPVSVPPDAASEGPSMNDSSPPYVAPVPPHVASVPPPVAPVPPPVAPAPPHVASVPPNVAPVPPYVAPVPIPTRAASEGPFDSDDNSLLLERSLRRAFPDFPTPSSSPSHSPCPSPSRELYPIAESSAEQESDAHYSRIDAPNGTRETSMDATRSHAQASPDTSSLWRSLSSVQKAEYSRKCQEILTAAGREVPPVDLVSSNFHSLLVALGIHHTVDEDSAQAVLSKHKTLLDLIKSFRQHLKSSLPMDIVASDFYGIVNHEAWTTPPTVGATQANPPAPSFEQVMATPSGPHHSHSSGESYVQHIGEPPRTPENQGTEYRERPGTPKRKTPQPKGPNPKPNPKPVMQTIQHTLDVPTTDATPEDPPAPSFEQVKTAPPRSHHPHPSDEPYSPRKRSPDEVKQTIDDVFQTYDPFLDRLKNGSLLSEEFKLGGEMSSVFARDVIGMDEDETDPLANEFSARVSLLSGGSGTGKTQTCARLLGKFCGLGISCRRSEPGNDPTDAGFRSMSGTLKSLARRSKFHPISGDLAQLDENRHIAENGVAISVLSRVSVLEAFLKCKPDNVSVETWKIQWALFELHPELSYKGFPGLYQDICERLEEDLQDAASSSVKELLRATVHRLRSDFPEYMKIFYFIIDEAQFGALEYTSYFRSRADPDRPRSFLTELVTILTGLGLATHTVISGISLSEDQIIDSVQSTTARLGTRLKVVYIPDGFYDKEEQRKYILKHLGPWAKKRKIPVKSFKRLVQRMLDLFPGRYRVTACFIDIVLRSDTECPHRLFTLFALRLTEGYVCTDGGQIEREEECLEDEAFKLAKEIRPMIDWEEYDSLPPDVKTTVIHMVARYITTGTMSTVTDKELKLVKASIGHVRCEETYDGSTDKVGSTGLGATGKGTTRKGTTRKGTTRNGSADDGSTDKSSAHKSESRGADGQKAFVVSITEPLVIFSLMIRCKDELIKAVGDSTRWAPEPCSQGRSYELQILVIIALMFGGQFRRLGDLLLFREKYKYLEDLECELVAIYKVDGEYVASSAGWGCGPSSSLPLGFRANKAPDLKETVERGVGAAFYLLDPNNHVDVEFYARPKGSSKIIRIHVQAKFTTGENGKIKSVTFKEAKQSLDPEWIYMSRCNKPGEPDRKLSTQEGPAIMEIFEKMRLAKHADYEPLVPLSAEDEAKIPDDISVIAIAGPEETSKQFWKCEEDAWGPLSVTLSLPFKEYFGATWALAGAQNMVKVPEPRAT